MTAPRREWDQPLTITIENGQLVIRVGVHTLAFAVTRGAGNEHFAITAPDRAAEEIVRELEREAEDGTTVVHTLLDKAAFAAWEQGGEGFSER